MNILTFNVNGIKSFLNNLNELFLKYKLSIACIQETRCSFDFNKLTDYFAFYSNGCKGRAGVATFVRKDLYCCKSIEIIKGRILKTCHGNFTLYNCYFPAYEDDKFYENFTVDNEKCIIVGDFNSTYRILDNYLFRNENINDIGDDEYIEKRKITKTELPYKFFSYKSLENYFFDRFRRKWLKEFSKEYCDTSLVSSNDPGYTCWDQQLRLRDRDWGSRIDYIFCSFDIKVNSSKILSNEMGSDHCPVITDLLIECSSGDDNLVKKKTNLLSFFKKK